MDIIFSYLIRNKDSILFPIKKDLVHKYVTYGCLLYTSPEGRRHVLSLVKALNKEKNITILMVTHHMEEVILADRIIVMDQGKIVMDGKPKEIFSRVDEMKTLGLEVPYATELAWELKKEGVNLSDTITTKEELVEELCQFV